MNTLGNGINYTISLLKSEDTYDVDELDCMLQQVLAIHIGWADQITPLEVDENMFIWERI